MYEVGSWFVYLLDVAILAILAFIVLVMIFIKRGRYAKDAIGKIRAEIQLPTGWSEYHTIPIDDNAKSVTINDFIYILNPDKRRFGKHPMSPFMGLMWLQVPIRVETWAKDITEPMRATYDKIIATSAEIMAMTREIQATTAAMQIQEIDARQKELTNAIANQPNRMIVYIGLGLCAIASIICLIYIIQLVGLMSE